MILSRKNKKVKRAKSYLYLFTIICCLLGVVIYIAPVMDDISAVEPLVNFIDERGIDAGALYYTDIQEFSTAEINMQNTMEFLPCIKKVKSAKEVEYFK